MSTLNIELRPKDFSEMIGNTNVISAIKKQIDSGNIPVAIALCGPTGIGKSSLAYIIRDYVQGNDFKGNPDWDEVNCADQNGVDDARELIAKTVYAPMEGKYRVIILDEAQKLTEAAQQALLKPLENKNTSTIWILCTTNPEKIIKPLLGRCLKFNLNQLTDKETTSLVNRIQKYKTIKGEKDFTPIHLAVLNADLRLPRNIVMAVEAWLSGVPANEAVVNIEDPPEFIEIARLAYNGEWDKLAPLLQKIKPSNWKEIRGVTANYFKSVMLKGEKNDLLLNSLAESIKLLTIYAYDDIVGWPSTVAILYQICQKMG